MRHEDRGAKLRSAAKRHDMSFEEYDVALLGAAKPGLLLLSFRGTELRPCSGIIRCVDTGPVGNWRR